MVNLVGVLSPICLLKINKLLLELRPGKIVHVLLRDTEIVDDLKKILKNSSDSIVGVDVEDDHLNVSIQKG